MDLKLALIILPVSDVDRAKAFYTDQMGFAEDYDMAPNDQFRVVQLTPPGSACSIAIGRGLTNPQPEPGSTKGLRVIVDDIEQARDELNGQGCSVSDIDNRPWGRFAWLSDPDGNGWELCQMPNQA